MMRIAISQSLALVLVLVTPTMGLADGDVTATVDDRGKLEVIGDDADNALELSCETPGTITFSVPEGGTPTTVNGLPLPVTIDGVLDKIDMELEGGADFVVVHCDTPKDLKIDAGDEIGDTVLVLGDVGGKLDIDSHYASVEHCAIGKKAKAKGTLFRFTNVIVGDSLDLESKGDVDVGIGAEVARAIGIQGAGSGGVEPVASWTNSSRPLFGASGIPIAIHVVDCSIGESLKIKKNGPGGSVDVLTTHMGRDLKLSSKDEDTIVNLSVIDVGGKFDIKLKDGSDQISMDTIAITKKTKIECKGGDDSLTICDTTFEGDIKANGGDGEADTLTEAGNTANGDTKVEEFETIKRN